MKHFTQSSPSSKSTDFDTNLTPIQSAAAIALDFGLQIPAVAAELKIHRSTLYHWARNPHFFKAVETAHAQFEKQFRTQIAMLTRLALTNIQQILSDTEDSPSVRLKTALAVLKQDWKLPESTEFDTIPEESDPLRNEMPPGVPGAGTATRAHRAAKRGAKRKRNNDFRRAEQAPLCACSRKASPERKDRSQRILPLRFHAQIQTLLRQPSPGPFDNFDNTFPMESIACETKCTPEIAPAA
jgi:hypothetical protein